MRVSVVVRNRVLRAGTAVSSCRVNLTELSLRNDDRNDGHEDDEMMMA